MPRRGDEVPSLPAQVRGVRVDPPRHSVHSEEVHGEERDVHSDEHEPEVELPEAFPDHPARKLRPPVVDPGEEAEDRAAEEDIVEMCDDEVRIVLDIDRGRGVHDPRQATDDEQPHHPDSEIERGLVDVPAHSVAIQLKIFTPVGIAMSIVPSENAVSATAPIPVANM